MICDKCKRDFPEKDIEESHDVPCYFFTGIGRKEKKAKADMFPRHWLCRDCHKRYEDSVRMSAKTAALCYSDKFFGVKK